MEQEIEYMDCHIVFRVQTPNETRGKVQADDETLEAIRGALLQAAIPEDMKEQIKQLSLKEVLDIAAKAISVISALSNTQVSVEKDSAFEKIETFVKTTPRNSVMRQGCPLCHGVLVCIDGIVKCSECKAVIADIDEFPNAI